MSYDPRYHQRNNNFEDEIGGYREEAGRQQRTNRPARHLGHTEQAVLAERLARQQAIDEARARQQKHQRTSRVSPDASPLVRKWQAQQEEEYVADDEFYEDEDLSTRPPRSAVKYQPEHIYQGGNTSIYAGQLFIPKKRRSAQPPLPPASAYQREQYTEEIDEQVPERGGYKRRLHVHWLVLVGTGALVALMLWISGAWVTAWWTNTQNDWTYTAQFRTFSTDAVVGHNHDSSSHPSHFIVQNDKRHILIIELPADDFSKAILYSAPTLIGDGQEKTPVTISFQASVQTGRLDMVLHVENQTYLFPNNGTKFVAPQGQ